MKRYLALLATSLATFVAAPALAQDYPNAVVRHVVPYAAGGTTDVLARLISQRLSQKYSHQVIVENRTGAGGNIAAAFVARAPADGHTLMMSSVGQFTTNPLIFSSPGYRIEELAPVIAVADVPNVLVTRAESPIDSVAALIREAKAAPGRITFASSGNGSSNHLAGVMLAQMAGLDLLHIPYKGSAPGIQALYGGEVNVMFDNLSSALQHIRSGKLRALAVTSANRVAQLPDVPTVAEAGLPGYAASAWFGIVAPKGTPAAVVGKLNADIQAVLDDADSRQRLADMGVTILGGSVQDFAKRIADDVRRWEPVVKGAGLTVN